MVLLLVILSFSCLKVSLGKTRSGMFEVQRGWDFKATSKWNQTTPPGGLAVQGWVSQWGAGVPGPEWVTEVAC